MAFKLPKDWEKDSDTLFIHKTGVRVHRTTYRQKEGWFLIPPDVKQEVVGFDATPEGRDKAFARFEELLKEQKAKRKAARSRKSKAKPKKKVVSEARDVEDTAETADAGEEE